MAWNAPGQHFRKGISLVELFCKFKDDETVEKWWSYPALLDSVGLSTQSPFAISFS